MPQYLAWKILQGAIFIAGFYLLFFSHSNASMPEQAYKNALQLAEKKVLRQVQARSHPEALSSAAIKSLFGRYYQVGDQWDVAAWILNHPMMRRTGNASHLQNQIGEGGIFHYEVLNVTAGAIPQVILQITQIQTEEFSPVDPKVIRLTLTMNDQLIQSEKTYYFKGNEVGVKVSPEGLHSRITSLEPFPLDVPNIVTADRETPPKAPSLPPRVKEYADRIGFKPTLNQCAWFEQDDFFGRPVQVLWQHGDPWPAYLKTFGGIAILIHKGTL